MLLIFSTASAIGFIYIRLVKGINVLILPFELGFPGETNLQALLGGEC
jgi:hypothetical protein